VYEPSSTYWHANGSPAGQKPLCAGSASGPVRRSSIAGRGGAGGARRRRGSRRRGGGCEPRLDRRSGARDRVPAAAEGSHSLAVRLAGPPVEAVAVERVFVVGELQGSVSPSGDADERPLDARAERRTAALEQWWPEGRAASGAGAPAVLVPPEEVDRVPLRIDEHPSEIGPAEGQRATGRAAGGAPRRRPRKRDRRQDAGRSQRSDSKQKEVPRPRSAPPRGRAIAAPEWCHRGCVVSPAQEAKRGGRPAGRPPSRSGQVSQQGLLPSTCRKSFVRVLTPTGVG
jgi:hypothetical protein